MAELLLFRKILARSRQEFIITVLESRFKDVPRRLINRLRKIEREEKLDALVWLTAVCPTLEAFQDGLLSL